MVSPPRVALEDARMERRTYALRIAYDGATFRGWQRQPGERTVQQALEDTLAALLGEPIHVRGAARTDAGAHAEGQVASFSIRRSLAAGDLLGLPVPPGISILAAAAAAASFHARASAIGKSYRYAFAWGNARCERAFHLGAAEPAWEGARVALQELGRLQHLAGLASPSSNPKEAPRLEAWSLETGDGFAQLVVRARAFRKHEVRNLAGHLAAIALGLAKPESLAALARGRRPWHGATAPAQGLTLVEVFYPSELDPFRESRPEASAERAPPPR
jgi:tRNA pseudouridine38-40 synthase